MILNIFGFSPEKNIFNFLVVPARGWLGAVVEELTPKN